MSGDDAYALEISDAQEVIEFLPGDDLILMQYSSKDSPKDDVRLPLAPSIEKWPLASCYYDPLIMDAQAIWDLITNDTEFVHPRTPWSFEYIYMGTNGIPQSCQASSGDVQQKGIFSQKVLESALIVVRIRQTRLYMQQHTSNGLSIDREMWLALLNHFDILPSFLELLHNNNGGELLHISDQDQRTQQTQTSKHEPSEPLGKVFHVAYKTGNWSNQENAIYGRCDLASGRSFILLLGSDSSLKLDRIRNLLEANADVSFLHVIHALQSIHLSKAEQIRWDLDFQVQELESQTGIAYFGALAAEPVRTEGLRFNKQLTVTDEYLCNAACGSTRIRLHFEAFLHHLKEFESLTEATWSASSYKLDPHVVRNLRNSCEMKRGLSRHQYDQIQELRIRIKNQREITAALIGERDTQINIEIAKATKRDSELMRGIAAVTMIFFPATFVATFFSMVFFHVGNEDRVHLIVDQRIWLYPVVTLPLTLVVAVWYLSWSLEWSWRQILSSKSYSRNMASSAA